MNSKRSHTKRRAVNALGVLLLAGVVYLSVVVFCLATVGGEHPARPDKHAVTWSILTRITPVGHHQASAEGVTALSTALPELRQQLRGQHNLWPWEHLAIEPGDSGTTVHVVATTEGRATTLAESVRDTLAQNHEHLAAGQAPPADPQPE